MNIVTAAAFVVLLSFNNCFAQNALTDKSATVSNLHSKRLGFFLSRYFRNRYDSTNSLAGNIDSVNIVRIEIWISDSTGKGRNVVAFTDLGEPGLQKTALVLQQAHKMPGNGANNLYKKLTAVSSRRLEKNVNGAMISAPLFLQQGQDFEKSFSRKLTKSEYTLNRQLGYISLNITVNPGDILAVAYEYTYMGAVYEVGEFEDQLPADNKSDKVIFLKLLKAGTSK